MVAGDGSFPLLSPSSANLISHAEDGRTLEAVLGVSGPVVDHGGGAAGHVGCG